MDIELDTIIQKCYIQPYRAYSHDMKTWLEASSDHFYVKFQFPSHNVRSWSQRIDVPKFLVCQPCYEKKLEEMDRMSRFIKYMDAPVPGRRLRVLDLFAGSGSFGLAMQETNCFDVLWAIELSPSACATIRLLSISSLLLVFACS